MQIPHSLQLASESGKKFMKRDMTPAGLQQQPFMQLCDEQLAWDDTWQANKFFKENRKERPALGWRWSECQSPLAAPRAEGPLLPRRLSSPHGLLMTVYS